MEEVLELIEAEAVVLLQGIEEIEDEPRLSDEGEIDKEVGDKCRQ